MEWNYLGHAGWLCVANGLRILFDPLLDRTHHGGVFEVAPRRTIQLAALRPDFLVITHAHTDHFDLASLRRLVRTDPQMVVFTSDTFVGESCKRLGFSSVHVAAPLERVDLDGVRLVTSRSYTDHVTEWGMIVECANRVAWNMVDTVHRNALDVRTTIDTAAQGLGLASLSERVDLLLARWQPLCEIAPMLGERTRFAGKAYNATLDELSAARPTTVVPASAGGRHVAPFEWLNRFSHPVPMKRFCEDIRKRIPGAVSYEGTPGARYVLHHDGTTTYEPRGASQMVHLDEHVITTPPEQWRPVTVPDVIDHNPWQIPYETASTVIAEWLRDTLAPALSRAFVHMNHPAPLRFLLELRYGQRDEAYTLTVEGTGTHVAARYESQWDALNVVSGSQLCAVIEGRACWGDVLLSGGLRAFERAYTVTEEGIDRANVGVTFVYYGLGYDESFRRYIARELDTVG
ncbi:MAG: MBL fold metallo-hydrolase [Deltaproteobacteria bacterium]|nr:MBL fold metallo-hydrolase [Deltaproteobacteria bacterium]